MIKSLVVAVALTVGLAGHAVAQEAAHRHHHHHRHHLAAEPSAHLQTGASAYVQPGPPDDSADTYWSPAGGNPIHYGQTTGFYAGR